MKRIVSILLIAIALILLWGSYRSHSSFMNERAAHRSVHVAPPEDAPPFMTFITVALGGFRGIIADLLWLRSMELQEQGRFFELAQLADWITKMQPHFVQVWAFHAWNMAYNISDFFPDPEDRWRWVQYGIQLLRDEGIRLNPGQSALYRELAWLYQHKIGYIMDRAHWHYKIRLAMDMDPLLEGRGPDYAAPADDPRLSRLREEYKLDPGIMKTIDDLYGPLEWRHPATHALYWAYLGREAVPASRDAIICARMIVQCMSQLFRQGNLVVDPDAGLYVTAPDLDLLPGVMNSYEEALGRYDSLPIRMSGFHFLAEAAMLLYCYGRVEEASKMFERLAGAVPDFPPGLDVENFVEEAMTLDPADISRDIAMAMVEGFMFQALAQAELGNESRARELEHRAAQYWQDYMDSRVSRDHLRRTGLPPLPVIRDLARERLNR